MNKNFLLLCIVLLATLSGCHIAYAGFGITPPYVKNQSLTRNSEYTQDITLVRGDPDTDLKAEVTIDVPGAQDWFTITPGTEFLLPKGAQKVLMSVKVHVPNNAKFKDYKGNLRIRTSTADGSRTGSGSVSIALGAQVDVDLNIIDKEIFDFRVRKIKISDLGAGHKVAWLDYPGMIRFGMDIENTGNSAVAPKKVTFNIYNPGGDKLLEQTVNTNSIDTVNPFETKEVFAYLPTHLPAGSYIARYSVYDHDGKEVKQEGEINLSIVPYGQIEGDFGYGFIGLSLGDKATIVGPLLFVGAGISRVVGGRKRKKK